jgi:hypothetical protein
LHGVRQLQPTPAVGLIRMRASDGLGGPGRERQSNKAFPFMYAMYVRTSYSIGWMGGGVASLGDGLGTRGTSTIL